jgi:hypothetical protein
MSRGVRIAAVFFGLLKLGMALLIPVMGDEAYYVFWGSLFSGGYYDLPPMIGWWLWPLLKVSAHPLWFRVFNLLTPLLIAFGLYEWLREPMGKGPARRAAFLYFLLPLPFPAVLSFPDVPLLFFAFFAALLFCRAVRRGSSGSGLEWVASGALFGAAFLSKYFAAFLLPAFLIWAWPRVRRPWVGVAAFGLGAAPFLIQHVLWNSRHCWANFVFNLISRQQVNEGSPFETTGGFLVYGFLMFLPLIISGVRVGRDRSGVATGPATGVGGDPDLSRFFGLLWGAPLVIFGVTALLGRAQGAHWLLFITPFAVGWAALRFPADRLLRALRIATVLSGTLGFALILIFAFPARLLPESLLDRRAFDFSTVAYPEEFHATIAPRVRGVEMLFTESYSRSSVLHHLSLRYGGLPAVGVWMSGSRFGRTFDWRVDWSALEGKSVAFLKPGSIDAGIYSRYFVSQEVFTEASEGANFQILVGRGFRAREFWEDRVRPELGIFYPSFLGQGCSMLESSEVFSAR